VLNVREFIPSPEVRGVLENLTTSLVDFESVAKVLQRGGDNCFSCYESRSLFDKLLENHETADQPLTHLHKNGRVVNNKDFENGIVKIQGGLEHTLTPAEKHAVKNLKNLSLEVASVQIQESHILGRM